MNQNYVDTVRLLLAMAPEVFASGRFAMKGGTALNLFVQEMPRLSVDIDLVFVDHRPDRQAALQAIAQELAVVQAALAHKGFRAHLPANAEGDNVKLVVSNHTAQVKVEVNFVFEAQLFRSRLGRSLPPRKNCSRRTLPFPSWPRQSSMEASSSRRWTVSIRATSST